MTLMILAIDADTQLEVELDSYCTSRSGNLPAVQTVALQCGQTSGVLAAASTSVPQLRQASNVFFPASEVQSHISGVKTSHAGSIGSPGRDGLARKKLKRPEGSR